MRAVLLFVSLATLASAQTPNPLARLAPKPVPEPVSPPARNVRDARDQLTFHLPAGWNFSRHDGEFSTFALDARSALAETQLHAAAALDFNPFPYSTFSGALFYVSVTPRSTALSCSNQAAAPASHTSPPVMLDDLTFKRGYNEHGGSCVESRDDVYTALRGRNCLRFDLVINTFCGGEVSGARDMTPAELDAVRRRMEGVLHSVRFDRGQTPGEPSLSRHSDTDN